MVNVINLLSVSVYRETEKCLLCKSTLDNNEFFEATLSKLEQHRQQQLFLSKII